MLKYLKPLIAPVFAAVIAASVASVMVAHGALWQWSKTAATNATADPTINWAEGMSPSSVNDSSRAMMARLAEWRDDISGSLVTTGTSTAYVLATNQATIATTPANGQMLAFTVHATNGTAATIAVDGGTAFPIQQSPAVAVPPNTLISGTPYTATFKTASNAWILRDFYADPTATPIGSVVLYSGTTAPNSNFVLAAAQCISRTTYATYFALVSTTFGVCDGTTTFGVPDLRGRMVAGINNMNGSDAGRISTGGSGCDGNTAGTGCGAQNVTISTANLPSHTHTVAGTTSSDGSHTHTANVSDPGHSHGVSGGTRGGTSDTTGQTGGSFTVPVGPSAIAISTGATGVTVSNVAAGTHSHTYSSTSGSTGGGTATVTLPPLLILAYIVRII